MAQPPPDQTHNEEEVESLCLPVDPRHNVVANLEETEGFTSAIRWLKRSKISHAISCNIPVFKDLVQQFWLTAVYHANTNPTHIKAKINDRDIMVAEATIRNVLKLGDKPGDPVDVSAEEVINGFMEIGYGGTFQLKKEVKKTYLCPEWRFIAHVFCVCLTHRMGGFDGFKFEWGGSMLRLCKGKPTNISKIIYNYMCMNAQTKDGKKLLYPRFIQMILNYRLKDLQTGGETLVFTSMQSRIFTDCKRAPAQNQGKWVPLFDYMYSAEHLASIRRRVEKMKQGVNVEKGKGKKPMVEEPAKKKGPVAKGKLLFSSTKATQQHAASPSTPPSEVIAEEDRIVRMKLEKQNKSAQLVPTDKRPAESQTNPRAKRYKQAKELLNEEIMNKMEKAAVLELINIKRPVEQFHVCEDHREIDVKKLLKDDESTKRKLKEIKKVIKLQNKVIMLQQGAMNTMFEKIKELQRRLNMEDPLNFDDLFNYGDDDQNDDDDQDDAGWACRTDGQES